MRQLTGLFKKYHEITSYLFWGIITTAASWIIYSIFAILFQGLQLHVTFLGCPMPLLVLLANVLSWVFAMLFAFVTNKIWVFHSNIWKKGVVLPEFGKFVSARAATGMLEIVMVPFLVGMGVAQTVFGIEGMAAKIIVSIFAGVLNYILSKRFIFTKCAVH